MKKTVNIGRKLSKGWKEIKGWVYIYGAVAGLSTFAGWIDNEDGVEDFNAISDTNLQLNYEDVQSPWKSNDGEVINLSETFIMSFEDMNDKIHAINYKILDKDIGFDWLIVRDDNYNELYDTKERPQ